MVCTFALQGVRWNDTLLFSYNVHTRRLMTKYQARLNASKPTTLSGRYEPAVDVNARYTWCR